MKNKNPTSLWHEYSFSEIAKKDKFAIVDGPFGTQLHSDEYTETGVPLVRIENLSFSGKFNPENLVFISEKKAKQLNRSRVVPGDLIIAKTGATIGKSGMFPNMYTDGIIASSCMKVSCEPNKVDPKLILYMIVWENGQKKIIEGASGSTRTSINIGPFSSIRLLLPESKSEQHKIAEILTTVDDAIEQTEALIRKYQRIKQGLMQDLLTRGVDENGELRPYDPMNFRNTSIGMIPSNWRIGTINDFAINLDSKRVPLKQEDRAKMKGDYPYYGASGVIDWINDFIFDGKYILIGEDGENVISRNLPLAFKASGKFWVNNHAHVYQPLPEINISFLVELLENVDYSKYISGSAQPKLTQNILSKISLPVPPFEEQKRIGIVIDIVNDLILIEKKSLAKWHSLKFGLMQDLLTGKVRVNALLEQ